MPFRLLGAGRLHPSHGKQTVAVEVRVLASTTMARALVFDANANGALMTPVAFYVVSDSRHFLGVVALLNSLRLSGHREPVYVADCGLTRPQRDFLEREAEVVPTSSPIAPHLVKWSLPSAYPAEVQFLVDADVVVLRSLAPLIEEAQLGKIVVFADPVQRFCPEWRTLLGLGALRAMRYCNAGAIVLPRAQADVLMPLVRQGQTRVDFTRSCHNNSRSVDYPFYYPDQDVWNALFAAKTRADEIAVLDHRLAPHPPFAGLEPSSDNPLGLSYSDGAQPFLLHHTGRKPWLDATPSNAYARLLPRLLTAEDLAITLPRAAVPARFRAGAVGVVERRRIAVTARGAASRGKLGLRHRLKTFISPTPASAHVHRAPRL